MKTKYLVAALIVLSLGGCYQRTSAGDVLEATQICEKHGGINNILVIFTGVERVACQDEFGRILHQDSQNKEKL